LTVSVEWSGFEQLRREYGPPYIVQVQVCKGVPEDWEACSGKALAYAPSKSGEAVDPSGSKTYSIQLRAPEQAQAWHLTAFFAIRNQNSRSWIRFTDMPDMWREFDVKVTDRVTLTVQTEPGKPGVAISIDGASMNTDAAGRVQFEVSIEGSHTIQVPSEVSTGTGAKIVFTKWADGQTSNSRIITLTDDMTLTVTYKTQYLLTVDSPMGSPQGSGWYDEGSTATFSVASPLTVEGFMGTLGGKYVLDHWSGDSSATTPSGTVTMNGPRTVSAEWAVDNTMPYTIIGGIVAAVIIIVTALLFVRRRRGPTPAPVYQAPAPAAVAPVPPAAPTPAPPPPARPQALAGKFCTKCGAEIFADALYCPMCASTTVGAVSDKTLGMERFDHAAIQSSVIVRHMEVRIGEDATIELQMINAGKKPATLVKIENVVPDGFELVSAPRPYRLERNDLHLKGKRLDAMKTEEIELILRPTRRGSFLLKPSIFYLDEDGNYRYHAPDPVTITVKEIGLRGWITGPEERRLS